MWFRLSETRVAVLSKSTNGSIVLNIYDRGKLVQTKTFDTEAQANTYIALQQNVGTPLGRQGKPKKLGNLKEILKDNEDKK